MDWHSTHEAVHGVICHHLHAVFREADDLGRDGCPRARDQYRAIADRGSVVKASNIHDQAADAGYATDLLAIIGPEQLGLGGFHSLLEINMSFWID
jgi:hypothetical protein